MATKTRHDEQAPQAEPQPAAPAGDETKEDAPITAFLQAFLQFCLSGPSAAPQTKKDLVVILDASGSMAYEHDLVLKLLQLLQRAFTDHMGANAVMKGYSFGCNFRHEKEDGSLDAFTTLRGVAPLAEMIKFLDDAPRASFYTSGPFASATYPDKIDDVLQAMKSPTVLVIVSDGEFNSPVQNVLARHQDRLAQFCDGFVLLFAAHTKDYVMQSVTDSLSGILTAAACPFVTERAARSDPYLSGHTLGTIVDTAAKRHMPRIEGRVQVMNAMSWPATATYAELRAALRALFATRDSATKHQTDIVLGVFRDMLEIARTQPHVLLGNPGFRCLLGAARQIVFHPHKGEKSTGLTSAAQELVRVLQTDHKNVPEVQQFLRQAMNDPQLQQQRKLAVARKATASLNLDLDDMSMDKLMDGLRACNAGTYAMLSAVFEDAVLTSPRGLNDKGAPFVAKPEDVDPATLREMFAQSLLPAGGPPVDGIPRFFLLVILALSPGPLQKHALHALAPTDRFAYVPQCLVAENASIHTLLTATRPAHALSPHVWNANFAVLLLQLLHEHPALFRPPGKPDHVFETFRKDLHEAFELCVRAYALKDAPLGTIAVEGLITTKSDDGCLTAAPDTSAIRERWDDVKDEEEKDGEKTADEKRQAFFDTLDKKYVQSGKRCTPLTPEEQRLNARITNAEFEAMGFHRVRAGNNESNFPLACVTTTASHVWFTSLRLRYPWFFAGNNVIKPDYTKQFFKLWLNQIFRTRASDGMNTLHKAVTARWEKIAQQSPDAVAKHFPVTSDPAAAGKLFFSGADMVSVEPHTFLVDMPYAAVDIVVPGLGALVRAGISGKGLAALWHDLAAPGEQKKEDDVLVVITDPRLVGGSLTHRVKPEEARKAVARASHEGISALDPRSQLVTCAVCQSVGLRKDLLLLACGHALHAECSHEYWRALCDVPAGRLFRDEKPHCPLCRQHPLPVPPENVLPGNGVAAFLTGPEEHPLRAEASEMKEPQFATCVACAAVFVFDREEDGAAAGGCMPAGAEDDVSTRKCSTCTDESRKVLRRFACCGESRWVELREACYHLTCVEHDKHMAWCCGKMFDTADACYAHMDERVEQEEEADGEPGRASWYNLEFHCRVLECDGDGLRCEHAGGRVWLVES